MKILFYLFLTMLLACGGHAALPTETRGWKSVAGTTLDAKATGIENETVVFEAAAGRVVRVPLDKLVAADRQLLLDHFRATAVQAGGAAPAAVHPPGVISGPIDAGGSKYYVYLPAALKAGRTYPLMFYTSSGGGSAETLKALIEGANICGWMLACSVESTNGGTDNFGHAQRCITHIKKSLPVTPKRIYFSGTSGGARDAFTNSFKLKGAGVLALIAGAQPGELKKDCHYYLISGAYDYNRYGTSVSYNEVKRNGAIRFHPGGHADGPTWLVTEGMVWLESRWQREASGDPGKTEFEIRVLAWVESLKLSESHRAAWWSAFLTEGGVLPANKGTLAALKAELAAKPENLKYIKGIADLEVYASKTLADGPQFAPDCFNHTSPDIQKGADKLLEEHATTPWIKDVLKRIKENTDKG